MMYVPFALAIILECAFVPWFLKAGWPKRSLKSTLLKCSCTMLVILTALCAAKLNQGLTAYAMIMLPGFVLSMLGDFFLDLDFSNKNFLLGLSSFLVAHLFYAAAYINAGTAFGGKWFTTGELIAIAAILIIMAFGQFFVVKLKLGKMLVPVACYTAVICTMLVKAVSLSLHLLRAGGNNSVAAFLVLTAGAVLFVISDLILSFMYFDDRFTKKMRIFNIGTYFAGQTLLAASILFIS